MEFLYRKESQSPSVSKSLWTAIPPKGGGGFIFFQPLTPFRTAENISFDHTRLQCFCLNASYGKTILKATWAQPAAMGPG